jgi:hypothetical protein
MSTADEITKLAGLRDSGGSYKVTAMNLVQVVLRAIVYASRDGVLEVRRRATTLLGPNKRTGTAVIAVVGVFLLASCGASAPASGKAEKPPAAKRHDASGPPAAASSSGTANTSGRSSKHDLSTPVWVTLPGQVVVSNNSAILMMSDNPASASFTIMGTTSHWKTTIDPATDLSPATVDVGGSGNVAEQAVLGEPTLSAPDGTTIVILAATVPASGLTASSDNTYVLSYDNANGRLLTKVTLRASLGFPTPIVVIGKQLIMSPCPGNGSCEPVRLDLQSGRTVATASQLDGSLQASYGTLGLFAMRSSSGCHNMVVANLVTFQSVSTGPCLNGAEGAFLNSSAYWAGSVESGVELPYSVVTGKPLGNLASLASAQNTDELEEVTGVRSSIAVVQSSDNSFNAGFYNARTFTPIYQVQHSSALGFSCAGIADNDLWVTTTSGNIVVDKNGREIAKSWTVSPVLGGPGWTVFDGPQSATGEGPQYLLRYSGPAVNALSSAPRTSS